LRRLDGGPDVVSNGGVFGGGPAGTVIDGGLPTTGSLELATGWLALVTGAFGGRYGPDGTGGGGGGGGGGDAAPADGVAGGGEVSAGDIQSESSLIRREGYRRHVGEQPRPQEFWNMSRR
jgi:hypothetical protein